MNGQKQAGLGGNVLEVANESGTILTALQVLMTAEVGMGFEEFGKGVLKFSTSHDLVRNAHYNHAICSFRWPVFSRSRSFIRALCS